MNSLLALCRKTEIARSFSYKLNMGNYESRDFFCSQKAECLERNAEDTSERLYQFCKSQVMKAVREYQQECSDSVARERQMVNERKAELDRSRLEAVRRRS